jgi:HEAT repeat protein
MRNALQVCEYTRYLLTKTSMSFYSLSKEERVQLSALIYNCIESDFSSAARESLLLYFSDEDTYIRKVAYTATGKIYLSRPELRASVVKALDQLMDEESPAVRQTVVNAAGEIGKKEFSVAEVFFERGLFDANPSVRNAVIGSIKKTGEKNPSPVLNFARKYLHHPDKEIRREICHGIELRGRTHPSDILPLLRELQFDKAARVKNTLVHVLGQISYKKGCLPQVIQELKTWENQEIARLAVAEIIDVHERYRDFAALTQAEALQYIAAECSDLYIP